MPFRLCMSVEAQSAYTIALVEAIFDRDIVETISFYDDIYLHNAREIDSGKLGALFDAGINPTDVNAKDMYSLHYSILSRCTAIIDFKRGINSVCPDIMAKYDIFARYFRYAKVNLKAYDILKLFNYKIDFQPGSNGRLAEDDAMFELEFVLADLEKEKCGSLKLADFLIFATCCDRIPSFGFNKGIDIYFTKEDRLACDLSFVIPTINTRHNILKALE